MTQAKAPRISVLSPLTAAAPFASAPSLGAVVAAQPGTLQPFTSSLAQVNISRRNKSYPKILISGI